jgi:hypothetical protein
MMFSLGDDADLKQAMHRRLARAVTNESISVSLLIDDLIAIVEQSSSYQDSVRPRGPHGVRRGVEHSIGAASAATRAKP